MRENEGMKENLGPKIIVVVVVIIMIIPMIMDSLSKATLSTIGFDKLSSTVSSTANYDFALVYIAPSDEDSVNDKKSEVKDIVEKYKSVSTGKTLNAYYLDSKELSSSQRDEIFAGDSKEDTAYMFVVNGEVTKVVEGSLNDNELVNMVELYSANAEAISEDLIHFNVPKDSKEFSTLAKNKTKVHMFVFGRDSCFYCNQFKIVYNTVSEEYDLDNIYYIDSDIYDKEEYSKIMDSGLKIPAKCSSTGAEVELQPGFGTPLTLFTKNGKVIDCINGYTNKANLTNTLKTVGIIEEDK